MRWLYQCDVVLIYGSIVSGGGTLVARLKCRPWFPRPLGHIIVLRKVYREYPDYYIDVDQKGPDVYHLSPAVTGTKFEQWSYYFKRQAVKA